MTVEHFNDDHPGGGCATCRHFGGWASWTLVDGHRQQDYLGNVWCLHLRVVHGVATKGCGHWEREPGTDDHL